MTLKERLKQLKAGADRQAAELGHEDVAGAAVAFGRVTGRALGNVVHDAGKLMLAFVPEDDGQDTPSKRADKNAPGKTWASTGEGFQGLAEGPDGFGYYQNGHHAKGE
ncbi:hypothetical protein [Halomonas elongata]|uniref:Uncharacterized protein n=1 Tax=Halomonas elongata (strain ATCC 33173 / DSM 2581 / NBRC 15536 / NCIMB 2198 / 1H9) TaxID=768066 RepID=A0ABZ0T798_HALED|nr:hypothetical protein [Halomonas elongata]WBF17699.1 hypothetical protein LM502_16730 [Halomonas elongata]WPU46540.1 hypothetical protein SR933_14965 [Halomonas elongata DSM 2581]